VWGDGGGVVGLSIGVGAFERMRVRLCKIFLASLPAGATSGTPAWVKQEGCKLARVRVCLAICLSGKGV
jgi:hypothetical protein